jgi:hypothetical protein
VVVKKFWDEHSFPVVIVTLYLVTLGISALGAYETDKLGWEWVEDIFGNIQSEFIIVFILVFFTKVFTEKGSPETGDDKEQP